MSRIKSFIILFFVYIFASFVGFLAYSNLPFCFGVNILLADITATVFVFVFSLIFKNASVYDPYWSVQPIVIIGGLFFSNEINSVRILTFIAILIWGIRLTLNWAYTFKGLEHQDWRYSKYKELCPKLYPIINFMGFHLMPTLIVYACIMPIALLFKYNAEMNVMTVIFFVLGVLSAGLQGLADCQMHKFRKNNTGKLIRVGVWKNSRHPNYFGEIMMWWSMGLLAVFSISGFDIMNLLKNSYLLVGAILNTLLFVFISVPLAEKHQSSRKEGFDEYKKQTRMFLPIRK